MGARHAELAAGKHDEASGPAQKRVGRQRPEGCHVLRGYKRCRSSAARVPCVTASYARSAGARRGGRKRTNYSYRLAYGSDRCTHGRCAAPKAARAALGADHIDHARVRRAVAEERLRPAEAAHDRAARGARGVLLERLQELLVVDVVAMQQLARLAAAVRPPEAPPARLVRV